MKRFKSILCASFVTFAISSTSFAGNISVGVASTGNISVGAASAGTISIGAANTGNISVGAASSGNISVGKSDDLSILHDFEFGGYLLLLIATIRL